MKTTKRTIPFALGLLAWMTLASLAQAGVRVEEGRIAPETDYHSVNGGIRVGANAQIGDLDAVNGAVDVGAGSVVGRVGSVNGGIDLEEGVRAYSVSTVNGGVDLGRDVAIERDLSSVNGKLRAEEGCRIDGDATTVNGSIRLVNGYVGGDIETYHGKVELGLGTQVQGQLRVLKSRGPRADRSRPTRVQIGPQVVVQGELIFEHEVELCVDPTASVGEIRGREFVRDGC